MIDLATLTNQFFLLFVFTLAFLLVINLSVASRLQAKLSFVVFTVISIVLALYSTIYSGEKKIILLIAAGLLNYYPFYSYAKDTMAVKRVLGVRAKKETIFSVIKTYIEAKRSGKRCINPVKLKGLFETRSSEILMEAGDGFLVVEGHPSNTVTGFYKTLSLVILGYLYYVFYSYLGETELFKMVSPLTVISILVIVLLVILYNARGFVESNVDNVSRYLLYELREVEKALEIARVINIAKKYKKREGAE